MDERERMDKQLRDLTEIIHFTENVSAKIHGLLDEAEIYRNVRGEYGIRNEVKSRRDDRDISWKSVNGGEYGDRGSVDMLEEGAIDG